jgi:phospholipase/carboxylesterase
MKPEIINLQGLDSLRVLGKDTSTAVVLIHGYGASMQDLFPLWKLWHKEGLSWYFPNGPLSLPMGYYEGRAWFSIDMAKLEEAMRTGSHRDMKNSVPPEFEATIFILENYLRELSKTHSRIILGGFSQGAMCATHLAMKSDLPIEKLILLSGALLAEEKLPKAARAIPFYQSHGTQDPVLSIEGAKELHRKLLSLGFRGELKEFSGGHEIPPSVIDGVKLFLAED